MKHLLLIISSLILIIGSVIAQPRQAINPLIHADVPDMSIIRVDDTYYMSSTTMHFNPGIPIMKSKDLVNWELIGYAYDTLADIDETNLNNGKFDYGRGTWASCLRHHNGTYYLSSFSGTTNKTYIYTTKDIEKGPWKCTVMNESFHDHTIFFNDDGKIYMIWGGNKLNIVELKADFSGIVEGSRRVLIEDASAPAEAKMMLGAEGSQLFKVNGKYYLFNICWPRGGMRTVIVHRADKITGPYEGIKALQDKGVAQGGFIDTPDGKWYSYLFQDNGAVGRTPFLVPVKWENGWPILGVDGKVPETLDLPAQKCLIPGIVNSDEFKRKKNDADLPLVWQWNHNPVNELWSVRERKGYLRLTTNRVDNDFTSARNTLTQRTIGPECSGTTSIDVSNMKDGDFAGLALLQKKYGLVGVKFENGIKNIVMISAQTDTPEEIENIPLSQNVIYFKAECDFKDRKDLADFYYSLDNKKWTKIGSQLKMQYTLPHFVGYRFGLFNYATKTTGGYADFDYFRISNKLTELN
ncbi:MAG TPA: glycoside hydrolase 43 family protein [Prolixibacteraceae bacterium]|nr:glycoside hydrolase 43 family protein [Prolixibacteraceae bacterium]